jgi:hypothetical protein
MKKRAIFFNYKAMPRGIFLISVLLMAVALTIFAYAGDDAEHVPANQPPAISSECKACESEAAAAPPVSATGVQRSPLILKLHEARKAGDMEAYRRLEAQLPKPAAAGESAGTLIVKESTSRGGAGDPRGIAGKEVQDPAIPQGPEAAFGTDIHVRSASHTTREWNQTMASDSNGNLYVAWQDNYFTYDYIQIYSSSDGGTTWSAYGYVQNASAHLQEPSLAVGEGDQDTLLLAYIVDDGVNIPYPEVATTPLGSNSFTIRSVPYWDWWEGYAKPVIWTDSYDWIGWFAYLTCEGIYTYADDNINVSFWRSIDGGVTWGDAQVPFGDLDAFAWRDADGTYGTTYSRVFLATYNDDDNTLYAAISDDFGASFATTVSINTLTYEPSHPVNPDIEAAVNHDHVMLVCTHDHPFDGADDDDIGQTYSTDAGSTWPHPLWNLEGYSDTSEFAPELTANEGGGSWHLAYTRSDWWVYYSQRPQDLSGFWQPTPDVVNDTDWASAAFPKKGIASVWSTDIGGVAWSDYRDGGSDYDTYFDFDRGVTPEPIINIVPDSLTIDQPCAAADNAAQAAVNKAEAGAADSASGFIKIGEEVLETFETTHPYGGTGAVWEKTFTWPEASHISIHFAEFDLAPGDYVEISSPDGAYSYRYAGKGKEVRGGEAVLNAFWTRIIRGDTAVLKLYSTNPQGGYGFKIDKWAYGYPADMVQELLGVQDDQFIEAICGTDDKEWAPCYNGTTMYQKSRAVARLLMNGGTGACTGWLLGSEGHLMTNNHCISTQTGADNTEYEFMAEGATCSTDCSGWGSCPGTVVATSGTLVQQDYNLDYSLILLPTNVTGTYGYLQFRDVIPSIGERIYIPQHPAAKGKMLAVNDDQSSGFANVLGTSALACYGGPGDIEYWADTEGGSSGSPVLAYSDHCVVALHHCRGEGPLGGSCPASWDANRGVPTPSIIADLGSNLPNDAICGDAGNTFTIYNNGTADLEVTSMTKSAAWLSFSPTAPLTIPPGGSQVITVAIDWDLANPGANYDTINVYSNDVDQSPWPVDITANKCAAGPDVSVTLSPDSTSVPRGGTLGYWVTATNNTGITQTFQYWANVTLPNGNKYPPSGELFGPVTVSLAPYASRSAHLSHNIPNGAPLGNYTYNAYVGSYPTVWDEDHFNFSVTSSSSSLTTEGPENWETSIEKPF